MDEELNGLESEFEDDEGTYEVPEDGCDGTAIVSFEEVTGLVAQSQWGMLPVSFDDDGLPMIVGTEEILARIADIRSKVESLDYDGSDETRKANNRLLSTVRHGVQDLHRSYSSWKRHVFQPTDRDAQRIEDALKGIIDIAKARQTESEERWRSERDDYIASLFENEALGVEELAGFEPSDFRTSEMYRRTMSKKKVASLLHSHIVAFLESLSNEAFDGVSPDEVLDRLADADWSGTDATNRLREDRRREAEAAAEREARRIAAEQARERGKKRTVISLSFEEGEWPKARKLLEGAGVKFRVVGRPDRSRP